MFNLINIIKCNRNTFYDYVTNEKLDVRYSYLVKIFFSCVISLTCLAPSATFIDATLQVHAILLGFSFNVLFYFLTNDKLRTSETEASIEKRMIIGKLNKLSEELFYNVSYFNIVALSVIIAALFYLLPDFNNEGIFSYITLHPSVHSYLIKLENFLSWIYNVLFYFLIVESLYAFGRNITRVSYYFQKRIELQN